MSQLRKDPVGEVPKRVLLLSLVITVLIVGATFFFEGVTLLAVVGFWMGVAANLINFRIIVIGTNNFLEKSKAGKKASMTPNIMLRFLLYGVVFILAWRLGTSALIASLLGACMVNFAFKSDGFFTMGLGKKEDSNLRNKEDSNLKGRASIDRVDDIEAILAPETKDADKPDDKSKVSEIEGRDKIFEVNDKNETSKKDRSDPAVEDVDAGREQEPPEEEEIEVYL